MTARTAESRLCLARRKADGQERDEHAAETESNTNASGGRVAIAKSVGNTRARCDAATDAEPECNTVGGSERDACDCAATSNTVADSNTESDAAGLVAKAGFDSCKT